MVKQIAYIRKTKPGERIAANRRKDEMEIVQALKDGEKWPEIMDRFNVSCKVLNDIRERNGIESRREVVGEFGGYF